MYIQLLHTFGANSGLLFGLDAWTWLGAVVSILWIFIFFITSPDLTVLYTPPPISVLLL